MCLKMSRRTRRTHRRLSRIPNQQFGELFMAASAANQAAPATWCVRVEWSRVFEQQSAGPQQVDPADGKCQHRPSACVEQPHSHARRRLSGNKKQNKKKQKNQRKKKRKRGLQGIPPPLPSRDGSRKCFFKEEIVSTRTHNLHIFQSC